MMFVHLHAAVAACGFSAPDACAGYTARRGDGRERAGCVESLLRRGGVMFLLIVACVLFASCCTSIDFHPYRACVEQPGTNLHDPGLVVWQELGDDGVMHYGFLPDRLADDTRQVLDVTRVNRACALITGVRADGRPIAIAQETPR